MIAAEDITIETRAYQLLIHKHGEILADGLYTEEEAIELIRNTSPSSFRPERLIMLTIVNQGHYSIAGWNIVLHRVYRNK